MAIVLNTKKVSDANWAGLLNSCMGSLSSYMNEKYRANIIYSANGDCIEFVFFNRELYVEFCLTWL